MRDGIGVVGSMQIDDWRRSLYVFNALDRIQRVHPKEPKSNFAKFSAESYPFRDWPQKQAVVYTSDIKREWFGATEGRDKPSWLPGQRCGILATRPSERFAAIQPTPYLAWSQLLHADEHAPCRHHTFVGPRGRSATASPPADRTAISNEAARVGHRIRAPTRLPAPPLVSARHAGHPSKSGTECRRARHSDPAKRNALPPPPPAP